MNQKSIALLLATALTGCRLDTDVKKVGEDNVGGGSGDDTGSLNDPPTVSVTLNPAEAYTNTVLTADATAEDPDSATVSLSYVFQVNGTNVQEGDSNTLDGAAHFNKGQTVRVIATATDGAASSEASSEPVLILNTPPSAPAVSVTGGLPGGCEEGWSLTPDGSACAQAFYSSSDWSAASDHCASLGADLMSSASAEDDAFIQSLIEPGTYLWMGLNDLESEGDWTWTDGTEYTHTGWDGASTPAQPDSGASLPGTPEEDCVLMTMSGWHDYVCESAEEYNGHVCAMNSSSGLFCSIDDESNDDDDDPITYTFVWTVDGEEYTGTTTTTVHEGDSIPEEALGGMADWTCTVIPNDGETNGPTGEDTIRVGDYDGDGVANDEDCAPADPDVPRFVLWSSIETVTMESSPPSEGSTWCDGAWGDQGVRTAYDRTAWVQESDWNSLWVPDPISDDEETYSVDVDLYLPSGNRGGEFGINRTMPGACNHSAGGLVLNYSDGRCGDAGPCLNIGGVGGPYYSTSARDDIFNRWVNMRLEVFRSDGLVQLWIDDELETCFFADDEALYGPQVKFNANSSCCSEAPNLGISNLNFSLAE